MKNVEWGEYKLGELFEIATGRDVIIGNVQNGNIPLISHQHDNNGISKKIAKLSNRRLFNFKSTLSLADRGVFLATTQNENFHIGTRVKALTFREGEKSIRIRQFMVACINKLQILFLDYSSNATDNLPNLTIQLPTKKGKIDFDFMESLIAELEAERIEKLEAYLSVSGLKDYTLTVEEQKVLKDFKNIEWGKFRLGVLFEKIETKKLSFKADELPKQIIDKYTLPCLTSSFKNQGLNYFVPKNGATILKNVISIPANSDIYRAYFQSNEFTVLSDAYAIRWVFNGVKLLPNQYLFAVQCINKVTDLSIYSYKNKLGGWNVVKNKYIQLPIKNDKPDYEIMETLISAIQKLIIKDVVLYVDKKLDANKSVVNTADS